MLNDTAFKVFELFLAVILSFILPVPKYFKIIFSRRTVKWLIILLLSSILLSIFNPEHFWEALFIGTAAAFPEEFIFRGIFLGYLLKTFKSSKYGVIISLVISTVLFSVYHFGNIVNQNIEATILQMFGVACKSPIKHNSLIKVRFPPLFYNF
ncbi:CPBP family intramembrane glutamic endopeptidase [Leuconostoc pseudomesenteroides]|uniref:CPBP family intramembrane glutamic endopeptidase n=1 Tax=Leuconostoc pseudomesenteroides TaxID=33968 RepID=UPI0021A2FEFD|nr:CPBP family intramembrane glutamic endopeptidase [Leuconostoc pseudomesenteroides]